jgi:hypothetical protein
MRKITHRLLAAIGASVIGISQSWALFENINYYGGIGIMNENLMRTTNNAAGTIDTLGSANYFPLFFGVVLPATAGGGRWMPRLGYTPLAREDKDGAVKMSYLMLSAPFVSTIGSSGFDYTLGTTYLRKMFKGSGDPISSLNGGQPTTYYGGSYNTEAVFMTVDLGIGYKYENHRFALDLMVLSAFSDKRSMNLVFSFSRFFGGGNP